jgi:hypothetical protein
MDTSYRRVHAASLIAAEFERPRLERLSNVPGSPHADRRAAQASEQRVRTSQALASSKAGYSRTRSHGVEYLMVGGLGARADGATRPTQDIDFVPSSTRENLDRLAGALRELGARLRVAGMSDDEARQLPVVDGPTLAASGARRGHRRRFHRCAARLANRSAGEAMTICCRDRRRRAWMASSFASLRSPTLSTASSTLIGPRTKMRSLSSRSYGAAQVLRRRSTVARAVQASWPDQ